MVDDQVVINPNTKQREKSKMYVTLAGTKEKITMIEAGADEVSEDVMLNAIRIGHEEIKKIVSFIEEIVAEVGKEKFSYESFEVPEDIYNAVKDYAYDRVKEALLSPDKQVREGNIETLTKEVIEHFSETYPEMENTIAETVYKYKNIVR